MSDDPSCFEDAVLNEFMLAHKSSLRPQPCSMFPPNRAELQCRGAISVDEDLARMPGEGTHQRFLGFRFGLQIYPDRVVLAARVRRGR